MAITLTPRQLQMQKRLLQQNERLWVQWHNTKLSWEDLSLFSKSSVASYSEAAAIKSQNENPNQTVTLKSGETQTLTPREVAMRNRLIWKEKLWEWEQATDTTSEVTKIPEVTNIPEKTIEADIPTSVATETPEMKTLREQVASLQTQKTAEQQLSDVRKEQWREDLVWLKQSFQTEAKRITEDIDNIVKWLEKEWGAITKIAASRIREARSAPLREQLVSIVEGIQLTENNIQEVDRSIDAILQARQLDRQNEILNISNQIEGSTLSDEQKNTLQNQLGIQTERMKKQDEFEAFAQKELYKNQLEQMNKESVASTWLTLWQTVTYGKILENVWVKEDTVIGKAIGNMVKEGKSEQEINKILNLATDEYWNFVSDTQFNRRESLRKEFEASDTVKNYRKAEVDFAWLVDNIRAGTGAADIAVLFNFMKTLDPTSVVRESEFNSIAKAAGVADKISLQKLTDWFQQWVILWPAQRQAVESVALALFNKKQAAYQQSARNQILLSLRNGVDPRSVVLDYKSIPWAEQLMTTISTDEEIEIDNMLWGNESMYWRTFTLPPTTGFNSEDQTSWTKDTFVFRDKYQEPNKWYTLEPYKPLDIKLNEELILRYPNEAAFKNNNPTWITFGISNNSKRLLEEAWVNYSKWTPRPKKEWGNYFAFNTVEDGMKAYKTLLTKASYDDIYSRLKQWVWTKEWPTYASNIMRNAGIPQWTKFSQLNQNQLAELMKYQLQKESPNFYKEIIANNLNYLYI